MLLNEYPQEFVVYIVKTYHLLFVRPAKQIGWLKNMHRLVFAMGKPCFFNTVGTDSYLLSICDFFFLRYWTRLSVAGYSIGW
jgi:hypothetical protein